MENHSSITDSINRRKFDRVSSRSDFIVETEKFQMIPNSYSKDVSLKGAQLVTRKPVGIGSALCIEIPSAKLQLIAEVRWIVGQSDGTYNVGVAFHELFPETAQKISDFIENMKEHADIENEGTLLSLDLELSISSFLNQYNEEIRADWESLTHSPNRYTTTPERSFSVFTPSKSKSIDYSSTSFRIDDEKTTEVSEVVPFRKLLWATFAFAFAALTFTYRTNVIQTATMLKSMLNDTPVASTVISSAITSSETEFSEGTLEKISWKGAGKGLEITFYFRNPISPEQIELSRINADQPRELIKISNIENRLDQKTINLLNPLASQIRLGLHPNGDQNDLHIVIDVADANVAISNKVQDEKSLMIRLEAVN